MKISIFNKFKYFSQLFSINQYLKWTKQKTILPFYHAVGKSCPHHLKGLEVYRNDKEFFDDLKFFSNHFESVPIKNISQNNSPSFHISFDDGLAESMSIAHLLYKEKIDATFFINSDFIDNKEMFYKHKQCLLAEEAIKYTSSADKLCSALKCDKEILESKIKNIGNIDEINSLLHLVNFDIKLYLHERKPYLSLDQLKEIKAMGFTIGNHTKSHKQIDKIQENEKRNEILITNDFLLNQLNISDYHFSFPFGADNVSNDFFKFLQNEAKIISSFGVSGLKKDEIKNHFHRIPMEYDGISAEQMIKFEYFYYILKSIINKNKRTR